MRRIEFIAHRGSSHLAPENTLAAFRLGWRETTTCELDVRATADGRLIVVHDETTLRTTGVDLAVARHSLAELQSLDAGAWKGKAWKGERLPSLAEVIAAMPGRKRLLIEIKGGPVVVRELVRVIRASGRASALALQSFDAATCARVKKALPDMPVYLLAWLGKKRRESSKALAEVLSTARRKGLDGVGVNDAPALDARAVAEVHAVKLRLYIWTINDIAAAKRLAALGVDGIITNRPGWLKARVLGRARKAPAREARLVKGRRRP
jgi:glycerophosphoryl diester phosphodiesterase